MTHIAVPSCASEPLMDGFQDYPCMNATSAPGTHPSTPEEWIACQADSLARILASLGLERDLTATDRDYGPNSRALFGYYDPSSHSLKTVQRSLFADSTEFLAILPRSGTMRNGRLYELPMLARPTSATGYGYWPTPTVCGNYNRKGASKTSGDGLATAVLRFPTPTASDANGGVWTNGRQGGMNLRTMVATLTARDWKSGKASQETMDRNSPLSEQTGGALNPEWVEWLMAWPIGATASKRLETAKSRFKPPAHGDYSSGGDR